MKSTGVAVTKKINIFFSFLYKPGAIKRHPCIAIIGKATEKAEKNATLTCVKNASCNPVNIILLSS